MVLILLLVLAVPQDAFGHSGGRTGSASSGCACHGGGANQVTPSLSGFPADGYVASSTYGSVSYTHLTLQKISSV